MTEQKVDFDFVSVEETQTVFSVFFSFLSLLALPSYYTLKIKEKSEISGS